MVNKKISGKEVKTVEVKTDSDKNDSSQKERGKNDVSDKIKSDKDKKVKNEQIESKEKESSSKPSQVKEKPKKDFAIVKAYNLPISTKHSIALCKFIKNKKIDDAISELNSVLALRKAVPMKGEIPHRRGKGMMSGRYPIKATKNFIKLLKSLAANAQYNGIESPIIVKTIANIGSRPFGRFGRVRKKRTHIILTAKSMEVKK